MTSRRTTRRPRGRVEPYRAARGHGMAAIPPRLRYLKIVEWSDEDGCYVGTCPGLLYGGVHGDEEALVYRELCDAVDEVIQLYQRDGRPLPEPTANRQYSGKFVIRIPKELHKQVVLRALRQETSLNSYVERVLRHAVGGTSLAKGVSRG